MRLRRSSRVGSGPVLLGPGLRAETAGSAEDRLTLVGGHDLTGTDPRIVESDTPLGETLVHFPRDAA